MTTILSREWQTQDCAEIAQHLKWLLEHVETLDQQLVTTRDINAELLEACKTAILIISKPPDQYGLFIQGAIDVLKDAIAKATGEQ